MLPECDYLLPSASNNPPRPGPQILEGGAVLQAKRRSRDGKRKAFGHAGITSAAAAVLEDLEANGILPMLLCPDNVRRQSDVGRNIDAKKEKVHCQWLRNL